MRRVPAPPEPPSLSSEKTRRERQAALDFYAEWDGTSKYTKYAAYKADDIRATLYDAFGGKCAYCETSYAATQPMAVEHYRPKGKVVVGGKKVPPGYYWLASEWTNLLPSCTDCNSPRRQELPGGLAVAGKANAFPLASEETRATGPGTETGEARLVLHPYFDNPEQHLAYTWDTGTISDGWVEPVRDSAGAASAQGAATIEVCALQRRGLVKARRERLLELVAHLESVVEARDNVAADPGNPVLKTQFERRAAAVGRFVTDEAPYSTMARQVVGTYYRRLFGEPGAAHEHTTAGLPRSA